MDYHFSFQNANTHYLTIKASFQAETDNLEIFLPNWRPGRYQIQNFAKRIRSFKAFDKSGQELAVRKTSKSSWEISNQPGLTSVVYEYYAFEMDAGNSWLDDEQLYVNFINCCIYTHQSLNEPCILHFDLPDQYEIASGLEKTSKHSLTAPDFYKLVDSPMFASQNLRQIEYGVNDYKFNIWIQGDLPKTDEEVIDDFEKFTALQVGVMGGFPCSEYHFLFQCLPYKHYHGVEHWNSTVITIGPSSELNTRDVYKNFLGVSSHELFHTWNVIRLRPEEMTPYEFQKENYHETGFVTEGVTTYYGDLFLVRSGVFSFDEYKNELNKMLKRHYENEGRKNYSVAESSYDLWLDGYEKGVPGRKVSIYNEGALAALILDLLIRRKFSNKKSLDDVMGLMWASHGEDQSGYSYQDYKVAAEEVYGDSLSHYFSDVISGTAPFESYLSELLPLFGLSFELIPSEKLEERKYGFRLDKQRITDIASHSPASELLSIGDSIETVNGASFDSELISSDSVKLKVNRFGRPIEVELNASQLEHFSIYQVDKQSNSNNHMLVGWLGSV